MRQRRQAVRPTPGPVEGQPTDAELANRAAVGDIAAFDELYRRHVKAAWRVAQAVTGNPHDAADAVSDAFTRVFQALPNRLQGGENFRAYLLASVRNASIDVLRRTGRTTPSDNEEVLDRAAVGSEPPDLLLADIDSSMVAAAFRSLPERWRSVLWLTEVENMPPREVAVLLDMSANGVAQLAVRARAGLRERFLQAHLREGEVRKECRSTVALLGAYAAGGLAPRDVAKVDQHLAGCDGCRARVGELADLGQTLHRSALPLPAVLLAGGAARWLATSEAAKVGAGAAAGAAAKSGAGAAGAGAGAAKVGAGAVAAKAGAGMGAVAATSAVSGTASLAVASVALFAASLLGVRAVDSPQRDVARDGRRADSAALALAVPELATNAVPDSLDYPIAEVEVPRGSSLVPVPDPGTGAVAAPNLVPPDPVSGAQKAVPVIEPVAQLGMWLPGPLVVVLALGDTAPVCAGVQAGSLSLGCAPSDAPDSPGATVSTGGATVPETEVTVPLPGLLDEPVPAPPLPSRSDLG